MAYDSILETTAVKVIVDDSQLQQRLNNVTARVKQAERERGQASTQANTQAAASARANAKAQDDLAKQIERNSRFSMTLRRELENGVITEQQFKREAEQLTRTLRSQADQVERGSKEYDRAHLGMQRLSTATATLEGRTSKLGISANIATGTSRALEQQLSRLGPAGGAAAMGLRSLDSLTDALIPKFGTELPAGVQKAITAFTRFQVLLPVAAVVGVAALARIADGAAKMADELETATYRTGLGIEALQEYRFAAQQTGVANDILTTSLQRLQRRQAEAAHGNKGYAEAFQALGVDVRDANGELKSTEELLPEVADGLAGVDNNARRLQLAFKLFDTEGARLLPLLMRGSEGMAELRSQARELGLVLSGDTVRSLNQYKSEMDTVQQQLRTAGVELTAGFLPILSDGLVPLLQNTVVPWVQSLAGSIGNVTSAINDPEFNMAGLAADVSSVVGPAVQLTAAFIGLGSGIAGTVALAMGEVAALGAYLGTMSINIPKMLQSMLVGAPAGFHDETLSRLQGMAGTDLDITIDSDDLVQQARDAAAEARAAFTERREGALSMGDAAWQAFIDPEAWVQSMLESLQSGANSATISNLFAPLTDGAEDTGEEIGKGLANGIRKQLTWQQVQYGRGRFGPDGEVLGHFAFSDRSSRADMIAINEQNAASLQASEEARLQRVQAEFDRQGTYYVGQLGVRATNLIDTIVEGVQAKLDEAAPVLERLRMTPAQRAVADAEAAAHADPFARLRQVEAGHYGASEAIQASAAAEAAYQREAKRRGSQAINRIVMWLGDTVQAGLDALEATQPAFDRYWQSQRVAEGIAANQARTYRNAWATMRDVERTQTTYQGLTPAQMAWNASYQGFRRRDGGDGPDPALEGAAEARRAYLQAQSQADAFANTVVDSAFQFSNALVESIRTGDIGMAFQGLFQGASSIFGAANLGNIPFLGGNIGLGTLIGGGIGILGSIVSAIFGRNRNQTANAIPEVAPRGGMFGTDIPDSYDPSVALTVGRSRAAPSVSSSILDAGQLMMDAATSMMNAAQTGLEAAQTLSTTSNRFARTNGGL